MLLVYVGIDFLYRYLRAFATALIVVVPVSHHRPDFDISYILQYRQLICLIALAIVYLPHARYCSLIYAPRLAPLEVTYVAVSISRYRRIVVDRVRHLKAYRSSIAAYGDIAVARICGG